MIAVRDREPQRLGCFLEGIAAAHDLDPGASFESRQVDSPRHASGADQADSDDVWGIHESGSQPFAERASALYRKGNRRHCREPTLIGDRQEGLLRCVRSTLPGERCPGRLRSNCRAAHESLSKVSDRCESEFQGKRRRPPAGVRSKRYPEASHDPAAGRPGNSEVATGTDGEAASRERLKGYLLSLPERVVRSASAVSAGLLREIGEVTLPDPVRETKLYRNMVEATLRFLIERVGEVEGAYPAEGKLQRRLRAAAGGGKRHRAGWHPCVSGFAGLGDGGAGRSFWSRAQI